MIESSYLENDQIDHAITITKENQLMLLAMTQYPDAEFKGVHMTAISIKDESDNIIDD